MVVHPPGGHLVAPASWLLGVMPLCRVRAVAFGGWSVPVRARHAPGLCGRRPLGHNVPSLVPWAWELLVGL